MPPEDHRDAAIVISELLFDDERTGPVAAALMGMNMLG
ncbi:hypothetical protein FHR38_005835 [Micromonospora polyrhachis]|uniref:Uncharacterized protein n=1 Tax=Micromonospora polyrhachis TaxID=1282883 RepID=A0A7W7WSY4_9ACTN|nr:hypothetical protein [Micromonospora polyrhachis]